MKRISVLLGICALFATALRAQDLESGLRLATQNAYYSPRQGALGLSFMGIGDDASSLFMNPAALTFIQKQELNFGFTMHRRNSTNIGAEPLTGVDNYASNDFISNVALVAPTNSKINVGIGYSAQSIFENDLEWTLFNTRSTFIDWRAAQDQGKAMDFSLTQFLGLANSNSYTPIINNLQQNQTILDNGGIDKITGALSYDFNDNLAGGVSVAFKFGSFNRTANLTESDVNNIYNVNDSQGFTNIDLDKFFLTQSVEEDIFGLGLSLGLAGKAGDNFRWSLAVDLPTSYSVTQKLYEEARVAFDNGDQTTNPWTDNGSNDYTVKTPFVYSGGASYHYEGLTLAAGARYTDMSQMELDGVSPDNSINNDAKRQLKEVVTYSFGVEYKLPDFPAYVRGGYENSSTPWASENVDGSMKTFSAGVGFVIGNNIRIDGVWRTFKTQEQLAVYNAENNRGVAPLINQFEHSFTQVGLGLTWRFND